MARNAARDPQRANRQGLWRPGYISTANTVFLIIIALSIGTIAFMQMRSNQAAEAVSSGLFAANSTFSDAVQQARETERPVFVLASAEWCGPCQTMKRTTLADAEVQDRLLARAVPYLLDVTSMGDLSQEDGELAQSLGVTNIPAAYLIEPDGTVRTAFRGMRSKESFLEWLNASG
ncbi:MAG: thioredoxin family protein [Planctomycetota bacterium]